MNDKLRLAWIVVLIAWIIVIVAWLLLVSAYLDRPVAAMPRSPLSTPILMPRAYLPVVVCGTCLTITPTPTSRPTLPAPTNTPIPTSRPTLPGVPYAR